MPELSGEGPGPCYSEGMSTGTILRDSVNDGDGCYVQRIDSLLQHVGWVRWKGKSMFIFVCFCRNHRNCGFPQIQVNMSLVPMGVISPAQPVGLGSCSPQGRFLATNRPLGSLLPW